MLSTMTMVMIMTNDEHNCDHDECSTYFSCPIKSVLNINFYVSIKFMLKETQYMFLK